VAGAESRLSRAQEEVREQVDVLRSAMTASSPTLTLLRAMMAWRAAATLFRKERLPASDAARPPSPRPPSTARGASCRPSPVSITGKSSPEGADSSFYSDATARELLD
ncbi:unnamed protein product, partial [Polarella glacialis]